MNYTQRLALYEIFLTHRNICTDTRKIKPGDIFWALKGDNFDGNQFVGAALESGATLAITDDPTIYDAQKPMILVDDSLKELQMLARHHRQQYDIPVIAITGTNGKTTTKELMHAVLSRSFKVHATQGNLNNHIGVPLTLLSMPEETEIAIIEMGANHPHEITTLCNIAQPNFGMITNIGKAHLEGFGSYKGVIKAKSELYDFLIAQEGQIFINYDDRILRKNSAGCHAITYGSNNKAMTYGTALPGNLTLSLTLNDQRVNTQLTGEYNLNNALAAAAAGKRFGVLEQDIIAALEAYKPENNRSQIKDTAHNRLLLDAYNANPSSMEAAIRNFMALQADNKVMIAGDMLELGDAAEEEHSLIAGLIESAGFHAVYFVGPHFTKASTLPEAHCFDHVDKLTAYLKANPIEGCTILVKGSRGIQLEKITDRL